MQVSAAVAYSHSHRTSEAGTRSCHHAATCGEAMLQVLRYLSWEDRAAMACVCKVHAQLRREGVE